MFLTARVITMQGVLAATEHRWDDAEKQFRIVLSEDPNSASAWSNLGNVHLSKSRPNEAFSDFSEAIRLAPSVSGNQCFSFAHSINI